MDVHITRAGKKIGIFNSDLLQELLTHGVVRPDDQAWIEGAAISQAVKEMFPNLDVPTPKAAALQRAERQKTETTRVPSLQTFESTQSTKRPSSSIKVVAASVPARTVPVTELAPDNNWSGPAKASWIILFLACAAAVVPFLGFASWLVAGPLLLIVFILAIVVIARGGTGHGIVILLTSLIAAPLFIVIAPFVSSFLGLVGTGVALVNSEQAQIQSTSSSTPSSSIFASVVQKGLVTKSINNARQIITCLHLYSSDHRGEYPSSLNELASYLGKEGMNCDFHCPLLHDDSQIGYEYFGTDMTDSDPGDKIVVMSKKVLDGKRVVVHNDCRVEFEVPLPAFIPKTPSRPTQLNERLTSKKGRQVMEVLPFMLPFTNGDAARLLIGSWAELRPGQDSSLTIEYKADGTWNDEMQQSGKWMLHENRLYLFDSASKILQYTILAIDTESYVLCYNGRVPTDKREDKLEMTQEDRVSHVAERKK